MLSGDGLPSMLQALVRSPACHKNKDRAFTVLMYRSHLAEIFFLEASLSWARQKGGSWTARKLAHGDLNSQVQGPVAGGELTARAAPGLGIKVP